VDLGARFAFGGLQMNGDTGVIEFLNKALRCELIAVNQYWLLCLLPGD
jgi:bacterioferritin (cytochrome b1)